jgi:peptidoglycan/LPS O-acetylase OafA/YrhL
MRNPGPDQLAPPREAPPATAGAAAVWPIRSADRIPALDGLRGLAILLVILFHHTLMRQETPFDAVYVNVMRLGWTGVDLFFVLSGFLITGLLHDARGRQYYFRHFYARRALRIVPLYVTFVFFTLHVSPWLWPDTALAQMGRDAMAGRSEAWYWLFLPNILFALDGSFGHPNLAVTWSLGIEEQFYLVWPLLVAWLDRRRLMWTCAALLLMAPVIRTMLVLNGADPVVPYVLPFCRMDALAAGAWVALAVRSPSNAVPRLTVWARVVLPVAAAGALGIWYVEGPLDVGDWAEPIMQGAGYTLIALAFASLLALAVLAPDGSRLARALSVSPLRVLGKYSYALYLFHVPVRRFIRDEYFPVDSFTTWLGSPLPGQLLFYVVATAPALALAWASWHLLEAPLLRLRRLFPYDRP